MDGSKDIKKLRRDAPETKYNLDLEDRESLDCQSSDMSETNCIFAWAL